jgi:hypothetical protein
MRGIDPGSGVGRFAADLAKARQFNLDDYYVPYPFQAAFHNSRAPYGFMGGAAGPGKTLGLLEEQFLACNSFGYSDEAKQVHTLLLRRTQPKVEQTVVTRFREKFPRELYSDYSQQKHVVTWLNGSTTHFGSMQYEHNAWDWQGQWYHIAYDELCEFVYSQWVATSAWNRCPVAEDCRKYGAGNPIGVGADWVQALFVDKRPYEGMEKSQRKQYRPEDYAYFPATYLDNPVYANDEKFLAALESYPAAIRDALKYGKWGLAGGYFAGAWDPDANVYEPGAFPIEPWHKRWISCNWGFEHWATIYWHAMDDHKIIRTYREVAVKHQAPETLAETIVSHSRNEDGSMPAFRALALSHDAFASKATATMGANANSVAMRMSAILKAAGLPMPTPSTRDKLGREQLMYQNLQKRIQVGELYDDDQGKSIPIVYPAWMIASCCPRLIQRIPTAARDEKHQEMIEDTQTGDPLQGAGYGLYAILGKPGKKPVEVQAKEYWESLPGETQDEVQKRAMAMKKFEYEHRAGKRRSSNWMRS